MKEFRELLHAHDAGRHDVLFLSNYRDGSDVRNFGHNGTAALPPVMDWIPMSFYGSNGILKMIGMSPETLKERGGPERGRSYLLQAIEDSCRKKVRVVLFGATTKRLLRRQMRELRGKFSDTVFSIGDNYTLMILQEEVMRTMRLTGVSRSDSRILVIGPSGYLGSGMVRFLKDRRFEVVCLGTDAERAAKVAADHDVSVCTSFEEVGHADLVVACNPAPEVQLTVEWIGKLGCAAVVDVCEPYNLTESVYASCRGGVMRVDANPHSPHLHMVLQPVSNRLLRLGANVLWGCFTEAFILSEGLRRGVESLRRAISEADWMETSSDNQSLLRRIISELGLEVGLPPSPLNFGEPIKGLDPDFSEAV